MLTWTGGTAPFLVQGKLALADPGWIGLRTTAERTTRIPLAAPVSFLRVSDGATKTVTLFKASLDAAQEGGGVVSPGKGSGLLALDGTTATYVVSYEGLVGTVQMAHVHGPAPAGQNAGVMFGLTVQTGTKSGLMAGQATADANALNAIRAGNAYFNIHTTSFGGGEIRGQLVPMP